ncbi:MAG: ABC transporter substrate-binding protein [Thermomicrobiaceae bacterium]|nr:ABC transporter substrate-binding protein [Thermomicrobiaceae bacterium]
MRAVHLLVEASRRRYSRREIIRRGLALGLSMSTIGYVLAACGGGGEATPTSASSGGGGTPTTATGSASPAATATTSTGTAKGGGSVTLLFTGGTPDIDPHSTYDTQGSAVCFVCYEMLIKLKGDSTSEYEPMLAKEWSHSDDYKEWTFTLFDNIRFHDGTPCDAQAVVKSFQRLIKMQRGPYNVVARFISDPDKGITAVDAKTVKFTLDQGNPIFEAALASQYGPFVVSPAAVEQHKKEGDEWAHDWFAQNVAGTGPYKAKEINPQERLVFEKFPDYYRGWDGPHFDEIVFRVVEDPSTRRQLVESGEADGLTWFLTPEAEADLKKSPDLQVVEYDTTNVNWATFNAGGRLKDPDVRKGLSYAFPYDEVRNDVYKGLIQKSGGPLTPSTRGYDPNVFIYETDLAKAKELLGKGFKEGEKFTWMIASGDETTKAVAQLMQANLQSIGYDLEIREVDPSAEKDLAYGDAPPDQRPDVFGDWGWWPDYNDGYNEIYPNFYSKAAGSAGSNIGFYNNPRLDEILDKIAAGVSEQEYNQLLAEAQNILTEKDPAAIYFGSVRWYTILRKNIKGYVPNPLYMGTFYVYNMYREG